MNSLHNTTPTSATARLVLAGALAIAMLLTSCTQPTASDTAQPPALSTTTNTPTTVETDQLPTHGAPPVLHPLDTSDYHTVPCRLLTLDQAQSLNIPPTGDAFDSPLGNRCRWKNPNTHGQLEIGFDEVTRRGLSALYAANNDGDYAYFDELPAIRDYPAVANDVIDGRDDGACAVVIGVSDEVTFDVSLQLSVANTGVKDPCDMAATIAGMALDTIHT